ncbi:MAG: PAS domain-containing protein, partial [Desertifilum sp. SIO1I2]|nr:PAS domain-containing protein [Desertifilum sp. SIO1I2]
MSFDAQVAVSDPLFSCSGEMSDRIRAQDWSETPLGAIATWPQNLRLALSILLSSQFPMQILWGPEYIHFYNDAYIPIAGNKHPHALGQRGNECWSEVWEFAGPLLDNVRTTGKATWSEDQLLWLNRRGYLEECYFTFSYAPIYGGVGQVDGIFIAVQETTLRLMSERRLKTLQAEAQEARNRLERVLASLNDAFIMLDRQWCYTYVNPPAAQLFGKTEAELLGQPIWQATPSFNEPTCARELRQAMTEQKVRYFERYCPLEKRWFELRVYPFPDGLSLLGVDISDRKQVETELAELLSREQAARVTSEAARESAEAANRIKDEFLAVLSHELRTPLNPIIGWSQILQTRPLDPETTKRALETIERNAKLQTKLIEDLLDVSRILRGTLNLEAHSVDLATIIGVAIDTVRLACEAKSINLQTHFQPHIGCVTGDPNRLQQVMWNLFANAVKFTPPGGQVNIRLEQVEGYAQITVSDTGQGISPEFLPHVFEYFRQEDGSLTRASGGLGLGLAIVHHLVELHGGSITVESSGLGLGATFTVRLPLSEKRSRPRSRAKPLLPHIHLRGMKVLVVDDEA